MANKSFVVQYLIKAREQFTAAADRTRQASKRMRNEIARTARAVNGHGLRMQDSFKATQKRWEGLTFLGERARNFGLGMTAAITVPLGFLARSLKNATRDAEETRSKFRQVFQGINSEAESVADAFAKSFGLAGTTARDLLGDSGDLLTGMGLTRKEALKTSLEMNSLAADLASFKNFQGGAAAASSVLIRAMIGEREALKGLGIAITEKMVQARMAVMVQKGTTARSLEQLKVLATLALITEKSKNSIGDFNRTQKELANQERITSERTKELREAFGRLLLPAALQLQKAIQAVVGGFLSLSPAAGKTLLAVAAVAAVFGPLLLLMGSAALAWPLVAAAFAGLSTGAAALSLTLAPFAPLLALLASGALLVAVYWDELSAVFGSVAGAVGRIAGPAVTGLIDNFREAAAIITKLFGSDSEAAKSLTDFSLIGELIGTVIGAAVHTIIRTLTAAGTIIGRLIAAVTTMDFSHFKLDDIKAEFLSNPVAPALAQVAVGVNVGLDPGLRQSSPVVVAGAAGGRVDVGAAP